MQAKPYLIILLFTPSQIPFSCFKKQLLQFLSESAITRRKRSEVAFIKS